MLSIPFIRALWLFAVAGGVMLLPAASSAESAESGLEIVDIHMAFTRSSFLGVNEADALAAFKVFTKTVGERRGYEVSPQVRIFNDISKLKEELDRGTQTMLIVDSWEYLVLDPGEDMPPIYSTIEQGVVQEEYVLLVQAGSSFTGLADLQGKRLVLLESSNATTGAYWLSTELMAIGAASPQLFFDHFEVTTKPSKAVLPVFFGQADACIVDRSGFEIMSELNPQVGNKLTVLAKSDPYLDSVICLNRNNWQQPRHRDDVIDALRELNSDPGGRQILNLFKFEGVTPFENEHLETVRSLRQRHDALLNRTASR
jgi:phosphonate transport system substrate-binding protein